MPMTPQQFAGYQAWVNSGAQGSPPAWVMVDEAAQARQQQAAAQAQAQLQQAVAVNPSLAGNYDVNGTGYGATNQAAPVGSALGGLPITAPPVAASTPTAGLPPPVVQTPPAYAPVGGAVPVTGNMGSALPPPTAILPPVGGTNTPTLPPVTGTPIAPPVTSTPPPTTQTPPPTGGGATVTPPVVTPPTGLPDVSGGLVGGALHDLLGTDLGNSAGQALLHGANVASTGAGNTNQVQGSAQTGGFNTIVNNAQNQQQNVSQTGATNSTGLQTNRNATANTTGTTQNTGTSNVGENIGTNSSTGTQTGSNTNNQTSTTAGTSKAIDTVGFGGALQTLLPGTVAADQNRTGFLQDVMQTGGGQFGSQVDQAIRNSLTGPAMTGAGDSARARTAGYAAEQVARNNLSQRLQAANQLAGPSGTGTMTQQGASLTGQETSGTSNTLGSQLSSLVANNSGTNTNRSTNQGTSNSTGLTTNTGSSVGETANTNNTTSSMLGETLSSLAGSSNTAGTAQGTSVGVAAGQTPTQSSSGGGCFVCSVLATKGHCEKQDVRDAVEYKLRTVRSKWMPIGYSIYGPALARLTAKSSLVERLIRPIALDILHEELRLAGKRRGLRLRAWALHFVFHYGSAALGYVANKFGGRVFETRDSNLATMLKANGLYYSC
jgi:hypothetical protein